MNIRKHFETTYKQRLVHIEQMRAQRDCAGTEEAVRQHLARKISKEREKLAVISEIWNVH